MSVRGGIFFASLIGLSSCLAGCSMAPKPVVAKCTMDGDQIDVVSLDPARGQATLLSVSPPLAGTAHASPTEYEALFQPGPDGASRWLIKINRYTFRATREVGADGGVVVPQSTGTCERYKGKPL